MLCDEGEKPPSIAISKASVLMLILTRAISARYSAKVQVKATIGSFLSACQSKAFKGCVQSRQRLSLEALGGGNDSSPQLFA
jgi:hypothetical protein